MRNITVVKLEQTMDYVSLSNPRQPHRLHLMYGFFLETKAANLILRLVDHLNDFCNKS